MKQISKAMAEDVGKITKHIIHFQSGHEKTFSGIISDSIKVGSFTKMKNVSGVNIGIDHQKVEWFEVHEEKKIKNKTKCQ